MDVDQWISQNEALRLFVYDDKTGLAVVPGYTLVGHPTIGYGRALDTHGILPAEAVILRDNNKRDAEVDLQVIFGQARWAGFGLPRQGALTDIRFQLGGAGFRAFHKMITAACNGAWETVAAELLDSKLAREDAPNRSKANAGVLKSGEWP